MSYIHQMLVSRELGGAGIIALQLAAAMREQNKRVITWLPGEGAAAGPLGIGGHRGATG